MGLYLRFAAAIVRAGFHVLAAVGRSFVALSVLFAFAVFAAVHGFDALCMLNAFAVFAAVSTGFAAILTHFAFAIFAAVFAVAARGAGGSCA